MSQYWHHSLNCLEKVLKFPNGTIGSPAANQRRKEIPDRRDKDKADGKQRGYQSWQSPRRFPSKNALDEGRSTVGCEENCDLPSGWPLGQVVKDKFMHQTGDKEAGEQCY